jgi:3-isopropylmalate dehydrogenase
VSRLSPNLYKIAVLEGDGIGNEVVPATLSVLKETASLLELSFDFKVLDVGWSAYRKYGRILPSETLLEMKSSGGFILGPLDAGKYPADDPDFPTPSGKIRKFFDLYANLRPARNLKGVRSVKEGVDLVIVRENTEDLYPDRNLFKGYGEFMPNDETVISLRIVTKRACQRIAETAFRLASERMKKKVTAVNKANVLTLGDGVFLEECRRVASRFSNVAYDEMLVDSVAESLVSRPEIFDVLVTTNMFGDILSDEAAALVGGLGIAPALNCGENYAMAQAVHGTAPDIAGKGIANPTAEILSSCLLLDWLSKKYFDETLSQMATVILHAVVNVLQEGKQVTPDIGGKAGTGEMALAVISQIRARIESSSSSGKKGLIVVPKNLASS